VWDRTSSEDRLGGGIVLGEIIGPDILIVLAVIVVLFGGSQLPKLARSLGSAKKEFERGLNDHEDDQSTSS
jgi:sec-independent protein translocase protein TatA